MLLNFKKKEQVVHKIFDIAQKATSAVVATLSGVAVNEITQLRREARNVDVYVCVVRNTLLHHVIEKTAFLCLKNILVGQNIIAFSTKIPNDSARVFIKFSKKNENFKIKGAAFEGKFIDSSQIDFLSNLLPHKESLLKLVLVMKMNSMFNLIRVLYMFSIEKSKL